MMLLFDDVVVIVDVVAVVVVNCSFSVNALYLFQTATFLIFMHSNVLLKNAYIHEGTCISDSSVFSVFPFVPVNVTSP